jgi:hypothetical protein
MIRHSIRAAAGVALFAACGAQAAEITATAKDNTVTVYVTAKTYELCDARINFTYLTKENRRENGFTSQSGFMAKPGKHLEQWHFTHPELVAAIISDPIYSTCRKATAEDITKYKAAVAKRAAKAEQRKEVQVQVAPPGK